MRYRFLFLNQNLEHNQGFSARMLLLRFVRFIIIQYSMKKLITFSLLLLLVITKSHNTHKMQSKSLNQMGNTPQILKTNQTNAAKQLCSTYNNRAQLVDQYQLQTAKEYMKSINSSLQIDGLSVLKLMVDNQDQAAWDKIKQSLTNLIMFLSSFGVGLVILLLIWPFLLCSFCCCKGPQSKSVQNTMLILFSLGLAVAVGTSIYGLVQTLNTGDSIRKAGCSAAIVTNDLLYGSTTNDGKFFFSGFYQISEKIVSLQLNLGNISNQFSVLTPGSPDPTMDNALASIQTSKSDTIKLSNNDASGSDLILTYPSPINESVPVSEIPSVLPSILGSFSSQSGIVWAIYSSLNTLDQTLQTLRQNALEYNNQLANFNNGIVQIQTQTSKIIGEINSAEYSFEQSLPVLLDTIKYSDISVKVFYGPVIGLSILAILAALLNAKFNACRYLLPMACILLFFLALIGFLVAVVFSVALPPLTWGCMFIEDSMVNEASFQQNLNFLFGNQTLHEISVCMPFGNGDIISKIGVDAVAGLDNLTSVISTLDSFNINQYKGPILFNLQSSINILKDFAESRQIDIIDNSALSILNKMSNPSGNGYFNCNQLLNDDSWVPSNQPNTTYYSIPCTSSIGKYGDEFTCPTGVSAGNPCTGCMDTGSISNYYYRNPSSVILDDLNTRYTPNCSFNNELNNIWNNYYLVKAQALGPDVQGVASNTGVLPRMIIVKNDIDSLISNMDPALPNIFNTILSDLSNINNIIDPKYGLIAGLNCKLMGENFQRFQQASCGSIYKNIYVTRLVLGIASYGILLSLCFAIPLSKKQAKRKQFQESFTEDEQKMSLNQPLYHEQPYTYAQNGHYDRFRRVNQQQIRQNGQDSPIYFVVGQ